MTKILHLNCGVQQYAWGKGAAESAVARMKGKCSENGKFAELWVGTHVNCPSHTMDGELLSAFLQKSANGDRFFAPQQQQIPRFHNRVPFLLKLLSIETALSIQAHPNKTLAERLHAENPTKYRDPNHKPELIIAITPFEALCCFRSVEEINRLLRTVPSLVLLLGHALEAQQVSDSTRDKIERIMRAIYAIDPQQHARALLDHTEELRRKGDAIGVEDRLFLRLVSQYPSDMGCWMVYILNYVQLKPGEGLFLADSEPHAYLFGDGVEIMASSDNVVRAGLTPKWKDVPTLLKMLRYNTDGLARAKHSRKLAGDGEEWEVQLYAPPVEFPDFSIYRIQRVSSGKSKTSVVLPTIGLGFCVEGACVVNDEPVTMGGCFAVPYGEVRVEAVGECQLFVASMNLPCNHSAKL
ncbi:putative Phosphomannose isomerase type I [Trypanosoma vivax]|uniref:mannose-6-phosphate isomerase n=1 Tax=Trypanosoma vivax (strain Y486) TaxID=1055687 RepID=G0U8Y6_TRYVY|nr:putative Phosphomannose isomerase type I [Trypanosoma vivax]CCC54068.1 putative phosphomannose isomerase [Trypanosoma vivax Y486]